MSVLQEDSLRFFETSNFLFDFQEMVCYFKIHTDYIHKNYIWNYERPLPLIIKNDRLRIKITKRPQDLIFCHETIDEAYADYILLRG